MQPTEVIRYNSNRINTFILFYKIYVDTTVLNFIFKILKENKIPVHGRKVHKKILIQTSHKAFSACFGLSATNREILINTFS
jgi:hypothetical protein